MVLCGVHSCCSGDRRIIKDKGIVRASDPEECAGNEPVGSVVEAIGGGSDGRSMIADNKFVVSPEDKKGSDDVCRVRIMWPSLPRL